MALLYRGTNFVLEQRGIRFLTLKNRIAALNMSLDVLCTDTLKSSYKFFHRQNVVSTNVYPPKKRDVSLHLIIVCS